jgi:hypothetical protein
MSTTSRRFSEKQMRRYFTQQRRYSWKQILLALSTLLVAIPLGAASVPLALACLGLGVLMGVWIIWRAWATPTDRQFDEWLEQQRQQLSLFGYDKMRQRNKQRISGQYSIHGFILPGSTESNSYSGRIVLMKEGKDGVCRFSFNVFTFFYIADHYLIVFVYGVDALDQNYLYAREDMAYPYAHIADVATINELAYARLNGQTYSYMARSFIVQTTHRDVKLGAYISTEPLEDEDWQAPSISVDISDVLDELRYAVRARWS